jgi:hypothetical protein
MRSILHLLDPTAPQTEDHVMKLERFTFAMLALFFGSSIVFSIILNYFTK